jgi:urease gamma subunit
MRRIIAIAGITAALAGGTVAGVAIANDGGQATATTTTDRALIAQESGERPADGRDRGAGLETAAETIGVTPEQLREQVRAGQSVAEVAQANGVEPQTVIDAVVEQHSERIAQAEQDGRLSAEEAQEKRDGLAERVEARVNGDGPHERGGRGAGLETAAETIGVTPEQLREQVRAGQSVAEVAQANGVEPQTVIDAVVEQHSERIAQAEQDGRLSAEEAQEKRDGLAERVEARVNDDTSDTPRPGPGPAPQIG